ncbi:MAG: bifunctional proline dehydrogenase/L-glutamate gamma-semialdehyde dehydrogenase [Candidatus Planktophila sp.]|nr:bifunctional proline dehydrogenase/L-glutamate gamma-semialdehyde dehydrogenase [Candidatus Planktophila sp.]
MLSEPLATKRDIDYLTTEAVVLVEKLLVISSARRNRRDEANRKRFARLLKDPAAVQLTMALTDEVIRISSLKQAARTLRRISKLATSRGLGFLDFLGIKIGGLFSFLAPNQVMQIVHWRVRSAADGIILPAESIALRNHIKKRSEQGVRLNINLLGEAVLGDSEASARLSSIIELVQRPEINYISVKISSIVSQLIAIDHVGSVDRACVQLRLLYRQAQMSGVFVNLDMEEFRDLRITVDAFKRVLSEPEFESLEAGIVLQAYLPESHSVFAELVAWAKARNIRSGAKIKIRLVKGANLAMEKAEAELHGWVSAPYATKADVDASYARLIDTALNPDVAQGVRIGVASHNLFHLAWAIEVASLRGVKTQLDLEMLEGMANAEALAIAEKTGGVLLYTPVTKHGDFPAAVAYLVRRLDENTSIENYLRASFDIENDRARFVEQRSRFLTSITQRHSISTHSRRHTSEPPRPTAAFVQGVFRNQSDSDATKSSFRLGLIDAIKKEYESFGLEIPLVINGVEIKSSQIESGIDPGAEGAPWYHYSVANPADIDLAVNSARAALTEWSSLSATARGEILAKAATLMQGERSTSIAVMSRDAGKVFSEADPEISEAIDFARYYALSAREKELGSQAIGVVLVVPPWNFPYAIPAGGICAALAAGNTVIFKPAPEAVATGWLLVQQLWRAGVPKRVLQFLPTRDDEVGRGLITHSGIDATILTGGFETAEKFYSWRSDLNLMAETSGKNSILISASADIDSAVKDLVHSAFGHAGQKCSAASVAIVESTIFNNPNFINQLKDAVESLRVGIAREFATSVGPIIHPPTGALLRALTTLDEGEEWLITPQQLDSQGYLWSPGIKVGVVPDSWSHKNEWFGPVLAIMNAPNFETALKWQNQVEYGLTAGIHSLDVDECERWIGKMEAGNLYVNRGITGAVVNRQPFGGWKRSSVGATSKAGGPNYLDSLRNWSSMQSLERTKESSKKWWDVRGSKDIDEAALQVERNYQRYLPYSQGITVFIDSDTPTDFIEYVKWISELVGTPIFWAGEDKAIGECGKVRWLSSKPAPTVELLKRGISLDRRPIASRGEIEAPRWLLEQSVSITNHRYGNVGAGPIPRL